MEAQEGPSEESHPPPADQGGGTLPASGTPQINPEEREILRQIIQNQANELELRKDELALNAKQSTNAFEYSKLALQAQGEDQEKRRHHEYRSVRLVVIGVTAVLLLGAVTLIVLTMMDAKDVALEIVKLLLVALLGGAGGYGLGSSRAASSGDATSE